LAIGSIVITAGVPKVREAERRSRANITVADLHTLGAAFETYARTMERGWRKSGRRNADRDGGTARPDELAAGHADRRSLQSLLTNRQALITPRDPLTIVYFGDVNTKVNK
jgi:hypothetical protein